MLDSTYELAPDQVLLIRARTRKAKIVDFKAREQALEHLTVAIIVAHAIAGSVRITEEEDPKRATCFNRFEAVATSESAGVSAK